MTEERENTKELIISSESKTSITDVHYFITHAIWDYWKLYGSANMKVTIEFHPEDEVEDEEELLEDEE